MYVWSLFVCLCVCVGVGVGGGSWLARSRFKKISERIFDLSHMGHYNTNNKDDDDDAYQIINNTPSSYIPVSILIT